MYKLYNLSSVALHGSSKVSSHSSVPDMLDELARLIMFYKIIEGLAQVSFDGTTIMHLYIISVIFFIMNYF